jgi:hypothetical protein
MKKRIWSFAFGLAIIFLMVNADFPGSHSNAEPKNSDHWILSVKPGFQPSDIAPLGGTCLWYWKEAGIAVAVSSNPKFGDSAKGGNIDFAIADIAAEKPNPLTGRQIGGFLNGPTFDGYANNFQWYWQAIGATRPNPSGGEPIWQLGDFMGSGVTIGFVDTGAPAIWDATGVPVGIHPEFNEFDPAHPEDGGVVLERNPDTGQVTNFDDYFHGTAVGSFLAAQHRGEGSMRSLVPKAKIFFYKIRFEYFMSDALYGWWRAAQDGVQILNNSWGGWFLPVERYDDIISKMPRIFTRAATVLRRYGVLIVAAAGNDPINLNTDFRTYLGKVPGLAAVVSIPQDMPNVIVAGGTGPKDYNPFVADLSIYNPTPGKANGGQKGRLFNLDRSGNAYWDWADLYFGSSFGSFLNVVAPMGGNVEDYTNPLALYQWCYCAVPYIWWPLIGLHDFAAGTSFSSPITCGVAALAAEAYYRVHGSMPSPAQLAALVKASADDLVGPATDDFWVWNSKTMQFDWVTDVRSDKPGQDIRYGSGRVNAKKAIEYGLK